MVKGSQPRIKASLKTETLRRLDAEGIRQQLVDRDVTPQNFPELEAFWKLLDDYVTHGYGASGHVSLPRIHRSLEYKLTTRMSSDSAAVLRWTGPRPTDQR